MKQISRRKKGRRLQNYLRSIPYQFECKNQEKFATLYSFYKQGRKHGRLEPVLVCKMNDNKPLAVIDLEHFFEIIKE